MGRKRIATMWLVSLVAVLTASCTFKSKETGAREEFARKYSCPQHQIAARERADLVDGEIRAARLLAEQPSVEVRSDRARLEVWQRDQRARREEVRNTNYGVVYVEVSGCGHAEILACKHPVNEVGANNSEVECHEADITGVPASR